jgi:hypothetical protein
MRASDPRPAPVPTKRRRLRTQGMDEAGGIRLPAGAAPAEEAPSPASPPSAEAVLMRLGRGGGRIGAGAWDCSWLSGWWSHGLRSGRLGLGTREEDPLTSSARDRAQNVEKTYLLC